MNSKTITRNDIRIYRQLFSHGDRMDVVVIVLNNSDVEEFDYSKHFDLYHTYTSYLNKNNIPYHLSFATSNRTDEEIFLKEMKELNDEGVFTVNDFIEYFKD